MLTKLGSTQTYSRGLPWIIPDSGTTRRLVPIRKVPCERTVDLSRLVQVMFISARKDLHGPEPARSRHLAAAEVPA